MVVKAVFRSLFLMTFVIFSFNKCYKIIPERANVTYINHKYLEYAKLDVRRNGRKSPYFFNVKAYLIKAWDNNVTVNFLFYEYLHNEYRRSFVEIRSKLCDFIRKDPFLGKLLRSLGISCPISAGPMILGNLTLPTEMPFKWPFERCRIDAEFQVTATNETILKYSFYVMFIADLRSLKK